MTVNSRHAVETRYPFYSQIPFSFIFFANVLQWKKGMKNKRRREENIQTLHNVRCSLHR